jgi:hypothetical protein
MSCGARAPTSCDGVVRFLFIIAGVWAADKVSPELLHLCRCFLYLLGILVAFAQLFT